MKKKLSAVLALLLSAAIMCTACGGDKNNNDDDTPVVITAASETDAEGNVVTTAPDSSADGSENSEETTVPTRSEEEMQQLLVPTETTVPEELGTVTVDISTRYAYDTLSDAEKQLYNQIFDAAKILQWKVDTNVDDETWIKVFGLVYTQEPQLFYVNGGKVRNGKIAYQNVTNDQVKTMTAEINQVADKLVAEANQLPTVYDKLLYFHDWLVLNCSYEDQTEFCKTIYGALVEKKIQCAGYAKTMQFLCDKAGIPSMVITGAGEKASHAWNVVNIDGEWYNLDSTWDDPILKTQIDNNLSHRYFLVKDSEIHNISHFSINEITLSTGAKIKYFDPPACTADKYNYFTMSGKLYADQASAEAALKDGMKAAADKKERCVEVRLSSADAYNAMKNNLKAYSSWIKEQNSSVTSVSAVTDDSLYIIQIDLAY